ncbi:MAG: DUF488 domain-containing protein [Clostridium chrysemydis]|uniref:DUF488 domain-containing protein n=1 Tax=Clostridium chrysemydis TaxID=2665504 RepID=UPI003F2EAA71
MIIFTSYFAKALKLEQDKYNVVGITRYPPQWFGGSNIDILAPSENLLKLYKDKYVTDDEFREIYINELNYNKNKVTNIIDMLKSFDDGKHIVFCCYEKSDCFCHRHILGEYLKENFGIEVSEIG